MHRLRLVLLLAVLALLPGCDRLPAAPEVDPGTDPVVTMYVAPYTRTCTGMYEMQCLLVKEEPAQEWRNFYDQIEGFTYQRGFEYVLRVAVTEIPNPPADMSSRSYRLVQVVRKAAA